MRPGPNAEPNEEVPEPPDERRIAIGIVAESEIIAHVLYRTHGPPSVMTTKLHTLTLRQAAEGWRAMPAGELFGHHGSFAMVHLGHVSGEASERAMPAVEQTPWLERSFPSGLAPGLLAALLGRFEGNLYRVMFMLGVPASVRTARPPRGGWSIQEHAGHLLELERLGEARLSEFERRTDVLSPADMSNRATMEGNYNARAPAEIMDELFKLRNGMIIRLRRLNREQLEHSALHPRLRQPMNVMDWVFFMCEHDDHHLARMRALNDEHWQRVLSGSP